MTESASTAMVSSRTLIFFFFAMTYSFFFIFLDALAISHCLFRRAAIPVPDPPPVTEMLDFGYFIMNDSDSFCDRLTIVSDPLIIADDPAYTSDSDNRAAMLSRCSFFISNSPL